jgi:hypothetical protein
MAECILNHSSITYIDDIYVEPGTYMYVFVRLREMTIFGTWMYVLSLFEQIKESKILL